MRARTKNQKRVVALSQGIKRINEKQNEYFFKHCLLKIGVRLKSGRTTCLECAHVWNGEGVVNYDMSKVTSTCPNCKTELAVSDTRKKNFEDKAIGQLIEVHGGYQVIRSYEIKGFYKAGQKARKYTRELSRVFINAQGKHEIVGKFFQFSYYGESWVGDFSLRENNTIRKGHNMFADKVYPKMTILKVLNRNGFKKGFHKMTPFTLFQSLLSSSKVETLFKAKQYDLVRTAYTCLDGKLDAHHIEERWDSIKICLRNNYVIKEADLWLDYIGLLDFFGMDLKNAKFVCPTDLHKEHNKYLAMKKAVREKERIEEEKERLIQRQKDAVASQQAYLHAKQHFFNFSIEQDGFVIEPLKSVQEFILEGEELNHCVYESAYYEKEHSLVLSAKLNGLRTETIEIHLEKMAIEQARGANNEPSAYHDKIVDLVKSNIAVLRKIYFENAQISA
jgi:hypothetical protein